jgi:hypothetical protein
VWLWTDTRLEAAGLTRAPALRSIHSRLRRKHAVSEHAVSTDSTWRTIKNLKKAPLSFDCGSNHENLKRPVFLSAHFALLISNHY